LAVPPLAEPPVPPVIVPFRFTVGTPVTVSPVPPVPAVVPAEAVPPAVPVVPLVPLALVPLADVPTEPSSARVLEVKAPLEKLTLRVGEIPTPTTVLPLPPLIVVGTVSVGSAMFWSMVAPLMEKVIVEPGFEFAVVIACEREPGPEASLISTISCAAAG
jgi:hypothetical protein